MPARPRKARLALGAVAAVLVASSAVPAGAAPGSTTRVSQSTLGQPNGPSPAASVTDTTSPQLSLDGLSVAFSSDASNLINGDTNRSADVFVRRLSSKTVERVSVGAGGVQANRASHSPAISVDARYVAFVSEATNLVPGDTNGVADVFLRDRIARTTRRISTTSGGAQANAASSSPSISLYGRFVTFDSEASNLVGGDTNLLPDAFIVDTARKRIGRMMPPADGGPQTLPQTELGDPTAVLRRYWTSSATVSYNGRYVAFLRGTYERAPLVPSALEIFIRDRAKATYTKVDIKPWMGAAKFLTGNPAISADGRFVAFDAWSVLDSAAGSDEALVRNPLVLRDVFLYNRISRQIERVSVNSMFDWGNADSYAPSISAGGQYIAFVSEATNMVPGDTNGAPDVFVRDNVARTTSRMSVGTGGTQSPTGGSMPSISYEGRNIVFTSGSALASGDTNRVADVFRRDRRTDTYNAPPDLRALGRRTIDNLEESTITLRATDPNKDPLRYGVLTYDHEGTGAEYQEPPGATLDPTTGVFRWTPSPDQAGPWRFIFWVGDPRGAVDFQIWEVVVRSVDETLGCTISGC